MRGYGIREHLFARIPDDGLDRRRMFVQVRLLALIGSVLDCEF